MEVLVGPTFSIEVSSPQADHLASTAAFFKEEDSLISMGINGVEKSPLPVDTSSSSSSSIGVPDDDSEEEEEGEEVESGISSKGALSSLDCLEDSLPIKRGLSNHFSGKSRSFANLSEMIHSGNRISSVKDVEKSENPFNKKRRLLMANKWCRKSSFYTWSNPKSMPLLALAEEQHNDYDEDDAHQPKEEEEEEEEEEEQGSPSPSPSQVIASKLSKLQGRERLFNASFKSHSCFSLTDLQEQQYQ